MTADQFGDSRPQPESGAIEWQKLPTSNDELTLYFHSLAQMIRGSFNDYAFTIVPGSDANHIPGLGRKQPIKIPSLENVIDLFGLDKRINWRYLGDQFEVPDRSSSYATTTLQNGTLFEGLDEMGRRLIEGHLNLEGGFATPTTGIETLDDWTREFYGISAKAVLRRYTDDESRLAFVLGFDWPIEAGEDPTYNYLNYVTADGKNGRKTYNGKMVRRTKFLSYWDRAENFGIYYHEPFFQREENDGLKREEVEQAYTLQEILPAVTKEPEDSNLLIFLRQEETRPEGEYHEFKTKLGLDKLRWSERPSVLTLLRLYEMAEFLEKRYREAHGLEEVYYRDYGERIQVFRNQLWLLFRQQSPYGLVKQTGSKEDNPRKLYPPWTREEPYPKGLGPFDPGPHNYGGPNDPRGLHPGGPDPRGPDPRGPR